MSKGQITIPKDVRDVLGVSNGDRVTFIVEGDCVRIVNSTVYAMQMLQNEMTGEAERAGITTEDDISVLIDDIRSERDHE
jgi:AbrB family looped-hinge helix DNA binding protein